MWRQMCRRASSLSARPRSNEHLGPTLTLNGLNIPDSLTLMASRSSVSIDLPSIRISMALVRKGTTLSRLSSLFKCLAKVIRFQYSTVYAVCAVWLLLTCIGSLNAVFPFLPSLSFPLSSSNLHLHVHASLRKQKYTILFQPYPWCRLIVTWTHTHTSSFDSSSLFCGSTPLVFLVSDA